MCMKTRPIINWPDFLCLMPMLVFMLRQVPFLRVDLLHSAHVPKDRLMKTEKCGDGKYAERIRTYSLIALK